MKERLMKGLKYFEGINSEHPDWARAIKRGKPLGGIEFKRFREHYVKWCAMRSEYSGDDLPELPFSKTGMPSSASVSLPIQAAEVDELLPPININIRYKFSLPMPPQKFERSLVVGVLEKLPAGASIENVQKNDCDCLITVNEVNQWKAEKRERDDLRDLLLIRSALSPTAVEVETETEIVGATLFDTKGNQ